MGIIHTSGFYTHVWLLLLRWYYITMPLAIIDSTKRYLLAFSYVFSFIFLLKTLFAPWKGQIYKSKSTGFDIRTIFEVFISNLISRLVGFVIKLGTLGIGLVVQGIIVFIGVGLLGIWLSAPIVLPVLLIVSLGYSV